MDGQLTKTQVDKLGDKLRNDTFAEIDLKLLDEFRRSFHKAYTKTVKAIRDGTTLKPTGRPAKSTSAIKEIPIEIQVRSRLQHLWAEFSEKLSDVIDPSIKYGGGDEEVKNLLQQYSAVIGNIENVELRITVLEADDESKKELQDDLKHIKSALVELLKKGYQYKEG